MRSANCWPCSCPLPAITTTSPSRAAPIARAIASRRSGSTSISPAAPGDDLADDRVRLLAARVVRGHDREVGELRGDPAHQRPLATIAVAAAAEDADQPVLREVASRAQDVLERVGRVGVVDEDGERLALVDGLEAPGDAAELPHAARDRVVLDPEQARSRDRAEHVLDVEAAAKPRLELEPAGGEARPPRGPRSSPSGRSSASSAKPKVTSRSCPCSSSASRRPYGSPTLTAAGGRSSVKSRRLASK